MTNLVSDISPIGIEALDSPTFDAALTRITLADIARSNTVFGGRAAVAYGVKRLLRGEAARGALSVLDVGAGSGDVLAYLTRRWRGVPIKPIAADWHREAVRLCAHRGLLAVTCDARHLPLADGAVDIVVASQLLHHFNRPAAQRLVRELDRVARLGVVISDLQRARTAELWFRVGSRLLGFHEVSRHDGVVSLRRGFTRGELDALLRAASAAATVRRRPGYRLVAYWRTAHAHG
ncbi:MAG: methyltransferase domain-containing protein [Gemmatimonadetes bacterium]|nr:methyltransferase domain-containing protein [Gemmatimonadota bacterium]